MNFGLSKRSIDTLNNIFKKYDELKKVVIYGSRAIGNYKNGSDIDMTFEVGDKFSDFDLLHICGDLEESDLPYFTDCSIFSKINNPDLKEHIVRVGKVLYERRD
jgi:predicted nucleotidyltransferase